MTCFCRRYFGSNNFDSDDGHRPTIPSTVQHSVRAARSAHPCDLPLCLGAKAFCVSQEGKTMSQGALVKALAEKLQTTLGQSQEFLNALATIATREVKNRGFVNIPGLCMIKRSVKADGLKGRRVPGKTRRVQMRVRVLPAAALKKAMKRRSGAQETHEKVLKNHHQAQTCFTYGKEEDVTSNVCQLDTTPITFQQRYVWEKCLSAVPGTEEALPPEIQKQWAVAITKGPKAKHAVVNAYVPKDCSYKFKMTFTISQIENFKNLFDYHNRKETMQSVL